MAFFFFGVMNLGCDFTVSEENVGLDPFGITTSE